MNDRMAILLRSRFRPLRNRACSCVFAKLRPSCRALPRCVRRGSFGGPRQCRILRQLLPVEIANDSCDVSLGLVIRRDSAILVYAFWPCVVSGERFRYIVVIFFQQLAQVLGSTFDVCVRIERVGYAQLRCSPRHKLHQTLRAFLRNRILMKAALGAYHAVDEVGINLMPLTGAADDLVQALASQRGCHGRWR